MNDDKKGLGVAAEDSGRSTACNSSPETGSVISGLRPNAPSHEAIAAGPSVEELQQQAEEDMREGLDGDEPVVGEHTPGPWVADEMRGFMVNGALGVGHEGGNAIALLTRDSTPNDDERWANARLIAAAPDMLAALKDIADFCDDPDGSSKPESLAMGLARLLPAARAAIAKAEGK